MFPFHLLPEHFKTIKGCIWKPIVLQVITPLYSKTFLKRPLKKEDQKLVIKTDYPLMQVKSILSTIIKQPLVIKTFVLSILSGRLRQVLLYIDGFFLLVLIHLSWNGPL